MSTRFLFKGVEVDDRTREYILKRLERLEKLVDPVSRFEIEIDKDKKGKFRVEVMVHTPRHLYRAEETTESIEGSADMVVDQLETQIVRDKERMRDLKEEGGRAFKEKLATSNDEEADAL
jgi:putative sigma-54 modulation protein